MLRYRWPPFLGKLVILGVILLICVLLYYFLSQKIPDRGKTSTIIPNTSEQQRVFVKDLHKRIDPKTQRALERTLYSFMNNDTPDLYTGTIRPESYSQNILASNQTAISLLVDVGPVNLTYKVSLIGQRESYSINIECAPQEQQTDSSSKCENNLFL